MRHARKEAAMEFMPYPFFTDRYSGAMHMQTVHGEVPA